MTASQHHKRRHNNIKLSLVFNLFVSDPEQQGFYSEKRKIRVKATFLLSLITILYPIEAFIFHFHI